MSGFSLDEASALREYAEADYTEVGDAMRLLLEVWYIKTYLSGECAEAIEKELRRTLDWYEENTTIVTGSVTYEVKRLEEV